MVDTVFHGRPTALDYTNVPTAVFSDPCLACVGLTEDEARARLGAIDVYRSSFLPLKSTLSGRRERTLMKLLVDAATDRVVGAHMLGPGRGGDHPGARHRDHRRSHQGAVRRHHRDPSHRGRRVRDDADARRVMSLAHPRLRWVGCCSGSCSPRRPEAATAPDLEIVALQTTGPGRIGDCNAVVARLHNRGSAATTEAPAVRLDVSEANSGRRRRRQRRRWRRVTPSRCGSSTCRCPPGSVAWRRPRTPTVESESRTRATTHARCRAIRSSRAALRIHHRPLASSCAFWSRHLRPAPPSK